MSLVDNIKGLGAKAGTWKIIAIAAAVIFVAVYLGWSFFHKPAPAPRTIVSPPPAVAAEKIPGPVMTKPLMVVPPKAVAKTFPELPPVTPDKPVIDTAKIHKTKNGGATVTFMNTSTGRAETKFIPADSPWFGFEDQNSVGAAHLWTNQGQMTFAYYKRDIFQVKDFHVSGVAGAGTLDGKFGYGVGVMGKLDF